MLYTMWLALLQAWHLPRKKDRRDLDTEPYSQPTGTGTGTGAGTAHANIPVSVTIPVTGPASGMSLLTLSRFFYK